jgi:hypothetical protein
MKMRSYSFIGLLQAGHGIVVAIANCGGLISAAVARAM